MWSGGFDKNSGHGTSKQQQQPTPLFGSPSSWFNETPSRASDDDDILAKTQLQDLKRTRSPPPLLPTYKDVLQHSTTAVGRPSESPPKLSTRPSSHVWNPAYNDLDKPATNPSEIPVPKRTRLPFASDRGNDSAHDDTERPSVSPPRLSTRPNSNVWTRPYTDPGLRGNNSVRDDDAERELQAKVKRLARFRDELSQPEPSDTVSRNKRSQQADFLGMDKRKFVVEASDATTGHLRNSNLQTDGEDQESSTVIIGYCPDMCPEQERAERERKGDLDQYERLDGDRNHTTESLAVKKYTRTAEREASLIRPMEILKKTMDYLLSLLNQPYDDRFLGLYNFLWDRMRAIRMDLRMQHIFNLGAITMLEQMIRLHIIAMHELCEYTKGEGFSEGFDAHLNIEQMNKTSVELFQLYDDHRKNGIEVPTEREFRGYYALLKLDKHPGYKVEPSELSLDVPIFDVGWVRMIISRFSKMIL
ncbi:hypothetical protein QVD17_20361 [Tagetes erecta]|uniref:SAC3/GANP/THP3 conserved domain-containing protein n=1 Tax=Tagetes erecta TaxID=13708 RepID=A0AAD8KLL3_TARER|nr:hypothetical protein QVD17_20361 [Tagetes erecta]